MKELLIVFSLIFSGGGVEKIKTENGVVFHFLGERSSEVVIINHPTDDDDGQVEANAGEDITTCVGSAVKLTAAESYDPLGLAITYRWYFYSKPNGSSASLRNAETMNPSFYIDKEGEYYVTLEVKAEDGRVAADTVVVVAEDCNGYPNAVITTETTVVKPGEVILSAEDSSCINDEIVSYEWVIIKKPSGSEATISGSEEGYIVLDLIGTYRIQLTITSLKGAQDAATIDLRCIDGVIPSVYAYSQELKVFGALSEHKMLAVLIEFPGGTEDLTGITVYGKTGEKVSLLNTIDLNEDEETSFSAVTDYYEEIYVMGMIDEKIVLVKYCDRY